VPTPDDISGGIGDHDKVILNPQAAPGGETPTAPGEVVYDGDTGAFAMQDSLGTFNPRSAGTDDKKVKVTSADTVPSFLRDALDPAGGIELTVLNPGADEVLEIKGGFLGAGRAWLPCPSTPSGPSSNAWAEVASAFYDYSEFDAATSATWQGWLDVGTADVDVRAVLSSDGTVLGTGTATGGAGQQTVTFTLTGLPMQDDAIIIQLRNATTGSGAVLVAGFLAFNG
jgi:hypothetical protein